MNLLKKILAISLCLGLILSFTSCVVGHRHHTTHVIKHDNGKHKGWYKGKKGHGNNGNNGNNGRGKGNKHGKH